MDPGLFQRTESFGWQVAPHGQMRVPAIIFADEHLIQDMDQKVYEQLTNVATLPGIVKAAYAMPDAHWGYGFPIGGVAAFDASQGGVVSAGGVGFDVSCGVRTMVTGLQRADIAGSETKLADALYATVPVGVGSAGRIHLGPQEMDRMLAGGARWAVEAGYGEAADLERIEEGGCVAGAQLDAVSQKAKQRQRNEMGTLGSGNHYLELQEVCELFDSAGGAFGIDRGDLVLWIHCGSRGLGHQIGTEYLRQMVEEAPAHGLSLPDRELACAPIDSALGRRYLGPCMRRSTALSQIARSSATWRAACSRSCSRRHAWSCFSTSPTTPAKSKSTSSVAGVGNCTSIGKGPHGLSDPTIPNCRLRCGQSANPSSSAAVWAHRPTFSSAPRRAHFAHLVRPAMVPAGALAGMRRPDDGADAPSSTSWRRRASRCAALRRGVSRKKRRAPIKTWRPLSIWPTARSCRARSRACGRSFASKADDLAIDQSTQLPIPWFLS